MTINQYDLPFIPVKPGYPSRPLSPPVHEQKCRRHDVNEIDLDVPCPGLPGKPGTPF
jgi:hypothetical protein